MFSFSSKTISDAYNNLISCPAQVGGVLSIVSLLGPNIKPLTSYSLNNRNLKLKLSKVFDKIPKTDFDEAEPKYIIFSNNWEKHFFENIVKEKIDLLSMAIFFLRRNIFSSKLTPDEVVELFKQENSISSEIEDSWFERKSNISLEYNENDNEDNQTEFYQLRFKTCDFKSITFNSIIQKYAYEFSAAAHIQTLYSGNDIKKSFIYSDVCLDEYYDFKNELPVLNNSFPYPHNRIIFGAPGTGKSHKLEKETKDFEEDISIKDSEESMVQIEIQESGNNYGKNFAIGLNHSEFFKKQKPKSIREKYNCSNDAAYTIAQGMRAVNLKSELVDLPDDKLTDDNIKIELEKLLKKKDLKQAGAALIGYMYSDALSGRTVSELADSFDLSKTGSLASWIQIGVQASEYKFDISKDNKSKRYERVTFHPNYSYAQFVGTYKPIQDRENKDNIRYEYIPGPFMRIYVNAKRNPEKNFLLLIEEINRANVAAVFGDVFQLLDRQSDGTSQYPIAASEDQKNYLESCGISEDEISIPSNMYIWATMNSADQGVLPMDAAFKRRWDFEYIGIDDNEDSIKDYVLPIPHKDSDGNISYTSENWNKIRHAINDKLKNIYGVNEDKLLGPYFLSKSTLDEAKQINCETETDKAEKICSLFKSKVLMYLYEDVVKMNPTELFNKSVFSEDKPLHYSDLCNKFDELGLKIFDEDFVK